jgi:hypothetical protein
MKSFHALVADDPCDCPSRHGSYPAEDLYHSNRDEMALLMVMSLNIQTTFLDEDATLDSVLPALL